MTIDMENLPSRALYSVLQLVCLIEFHMCPYYPEQLYDLISWSYCLALSTQLIPYLLVSRIFCGSSHRTL